MGTPRIDEIEAIVQDEIKVSEEPVVEVSLEAVEEVATAANEALLETVVDNEKERIEEKKEEVV